MNEIKIDKNVPIPDKNSNSSPLAKAIGAMSVGDSIVLPIATKSPSVRAAFQYRKAKCAIRIEEKDGVQQLRVWRTT